MMIEKDEEALKFKEQLESLLQHKKEEKEDAQVSYLRQVVVKYLEQLALGKHKEIKKLETVLFTVLRANEEDIRVIKKARKKQTSGLWGYFGTGPQVAQPVNIASESLRKPSQED